ncbi:MAG: glucose-1-phosphate adenylyltransferase, partial [Selenomonadaceae bacterium]|nr:glucose-1-phosphate adenylyltransferase [Selenomonadaceae bacterium]
MFSYAFEGYWKDVGTIESLWQANMDLLQDQPPFDLKGDHKVYSDNPSLPPHFIGPYASVKKAMINEGAKIEGEVEQCVIFQGVRVGKGAKVTNSVVLPSAVIEEGAVVNYAIIAQDAVIKAGAKVEGKEGEIFVVPEGSVVTA